MPKNTPQSKTAGSLRSPAPTPKLRFPGFDGVWEEKKLNDLGNFTGGGTPDTSSRNYWNGNINWFTPTEIKEKYISESLRKITQSGLEKSSAKLLPIGTLLFTSRATIGEISISKKESTTNQGFQSLVVNDKNSNEFLYYWFKKNKKEFLRRANGSTFPEISSTEIKKIKSVFPPLPEQQKIASFLGSVDEWIGNLKEQKKQLEDYKRGMMQKIFSQEIRFKDENGKDFAEWEEKRLGEICEKKSSSLSSNSLDENFGVYNVYGATGFLKKIDFYQEEEPFISIVKDGAGVGRILLCEAKSSVLGTLDILKPKNNHNIYFLYLLLSKISFLKYTTGLAIPHIYFKDYSKEKIRIPSLLEQKKIAEFLSSVDQLLESKQQQITEAEEWKRGLMQGVFV